MAAKKVSIASFRESIGSTSFAESKYKTPNYWLDTGCYAVNRILSGNTYHGIPGGRITGIAGESQTCKSMMAANAIKSGQQNGIITHTFYLDTEGGALYEYFDQMGIDLEKVEHVLIEDVEQFVSVIVQVFDYITNFQAENPDAKFIIVVDSIGAMRSKKLYADGLRGEIPVDMGSVARKIGDGLSLATVRALKTDTAMILLNHTYENPGEMMPQKIKSQYGGNKVIYMSRYLLQLSKVFRKSDKLYGESDDDTFYNGSEVTVFCSKNASIRPFFEARMLNNFTDPASTKYFGMFDVAEGYGFIVRESSMYKIPEYSGDKKWYAKDIICGKESDQIWAKLLPLINERSAVDMAFGNNSNAPGFSDVKNREETPDINSNSTDHIRL